MINFVPIDNADESLNISKIVNVYSKNIKYMK